MYVIWCIWRRQGGAECVCGPSVMAEACLTLDQSHANVSFLSAGLSCGPCDRHSCVSWVSITRVLSLPFGNVTERLSHSIDPSSDINERPLTVPSHDLSMDCHESLQHTMWPPSLDSAHEMDAPSCVRARDFLRRPADATRFCQWHAWYAWAASCVPRNKNHTRYRNLQYCVQTFREPLRSIQTIRISTYVAMPGRLKPIVRRTPCPILNFRSIFVCGLMLEANWLSKHTTTTPLS